MGAKVAALEEEMSRFSGGMNTLMVANGSVANQLVFELWKIKNPAVTPVVICPAVTWISSITPAMMAGMEVVFCDVNLTDFAFDYDHLKNLLDRYADRRVIIWPTALIGFVPDMARLHALAAAHGAADVYLDSCENTFGWVNGNSDSILRSADITTTSTYLSHHITSVEGGFVFFKHRSDYDLGRMFRNHGMTRSLPPSNALRQTFETTYPEVDPQFLFGLPGTNLRPSDVHAMFGLADMKRAYEAMRHRIAIYDQFSLTLAQDRYYLPPRQLGHVAFCLPIFVREDGKLASVKEALTDAGIEVRPIVGSHLGKQPALKHLFELGPVYPNAQWIHDHGCYVGLGGHVTPRMVEKLTTVLNNLGGDPLA